MTPPQSSAERRNREGRYLKLQIKLALLLCALLIISGLGFVVYGFITYSPLDRESLSSFSAYVAGIFGSLISLASALLIFVAFLGQRLESHQREQEIDSSASQLATQQFESLFVSFLGFHYETVKSIAGKFDNDDTVYVGRVFFERVYIDLSTEYKKVSEIASSNEEAAISAYDAVNKRHRQELGHYFRNLYNIVKFIDQSTFVDKQKYADLLRAQLSTYESLMLFYNCLHPKGRSKFHGLVSKYHLLESVPIDQLLEADHSRLYPTEAYGTRRHVG